MLRRLRQWRRRRGTGSMLLGALLMISGVQAKAQERVWTDLKGRKISASLVSTTGDSAKLRLKSGKISSIDVAKLSASDVEFIRTWKRARIEWPDEVDISDELKVTTVKEDEDEREFVYRTQHFEFHSDRKIADSLIKDFSLAFEATFAGLAALPLQLDPKPPEGFFQIRLFGDRFDYYAAGGMPSTAGVYVPSERHILVPMEGLNLKLVGSELRKNNSEYDNSTLIHEITHQVMHEWLKHLPVWVVEGMSEYMSSLPYSPGKFRFSESAHKNGLKAALKRWEGGLRQSRYSIRPATEVFALDSRMWNQAEGAEAVSNYSSSMLYVYYFLHLDGQGRGERMVDFFRSIDTAKPTVSEYLTEYETTLRDFLAKMKAAEASGRRPSFEDGGIPEILQTPVQRVVYKSGSSHRKALDTLMAGRTPEFITTAVIEAFKKEGIRLR